MTLQSTQDQYLCHQKINRKSRRVYDFSIPTLRLYSCMRQDDAAKVLGVAPITLKRICHRRNYRWPYRAVKAAEKRRERQRAAAIAAALAAGASLADVTAEAQASRGPTPHPASSPSRQFNRLGQLERQFPHDNAASPMELTNWLSWAASPTDAKDSPPSTALSAPARLPMSPQKDKTAAKTAASPMSELSLGYAAMSVANTRLPPLRVALHPSYLAVRQHDQRLGAELRVRLACHGHRGDVGRTSAA